MRNAAALKKVSVFTAQVYWTLRWINTVLMKEKHVKITQRAMECFNTCGFLRCLHLLVSLCCISHAEGQAGGIGLSKHLAEILHFVPDDCKAQDYNYGIIGVIIMEDKTFCFKRRVCIRSVCGLVLFLFYKP